MTKHTNPTRCSTTTEFVRADRLRLGDQVLMTTWRETVEVVTVTSLAFEGEDVLLNGTTSTSPGNTFQTVSVR